jgi:D-alanyl-D-alanine carboxypeptidase
MIQIGATDNAAKATELLVRAKSEGRKALSGAQPFTEKVEKGSGTLYRARFAGLEADSAELACKTLKRSGFACFATRN